MFQHEVPPLSRFVDSRGWDGETATTYQSTQLSIYIGPFRLAVGHQALLPYALCIGPNQQGSGSAKTVCFYGSAQEFVETRILGCFLKHDEFGLGDCHALGLEQQVAEILVAAAPSK